MDEQSIHVRDVLKDFDNELDQSGNSRIHQVSFVTLNGSLKYFEKAYKIGLPQRVGKDKRLRNLCCAITGETCMFDFRLLISFNGKKVRY